MHLFFVATAMNYNSCKISKHRFKAVRARLAVAEENLFAKIKPERLFLFKKYENKILSFVQAEYELSRRTVI